MNRLSLDQQKRRVEIDALAIENELVFTYFDRLPKEERNDKLFKAIYIGVLALMEDRLSAFLSKTANELGTELESLKLIFDMKREVFYGSTASGAIAEADIAEFLNIQFKKLGLRDQAELTGNSTGVIPRNKTGDIVCHLDGKNEVRVIIECKFDKSLKLGEIADKDIFARNSDTAWSQLIEAAANRDGRVAIIVFDRAKVDAKILNVVENLKYIPEIGFIVIVNSQAGEYANLMIAYSLARDIAINAKPVSLDKDLLAAMLNRIISDLKDILAIRTMVEENITHNQKILKQLNQSMLSMEFSREYLLNFLREGTIGKADLLQFYQGGDLRAKFQPIEKEIDNLSKS
jgi:hypothetical protein